MYALAVRTDLDRVCLTCLARTAAVGECPVCGASLADLRDDDVRRGALQLLEKRAAELERQWRAKRDRLQRSGFVRGDALDRANHTIVSLSVALLAMAVPLLLLKVPLWIVIGLPAALVFGFGAYV